MQSKYIAAGLSLFSFGALVGWAITGDLHQQKYDRDMADTERLLRNKTEHIFALKDRIWELENTNPAVLNVFNQIDVEDFKQKAHEAQEAVDAFVEEAAVETDVETDEVPEEIQTVLEEMDEDAPDEPVEVTRTNLQNLISQYVANEDDRDLFVARAEPTVKKNFDPPFVISKLKYAWDEEEGDDFTKITVTYYPIDRTLLDDDGDVIDDVNGTVGWKNLNSFGAESEDPDTVFIRNRRLLTDFEVVRETDRPLPTHVRYGMSRAEFATNKAAGLIKFRPEDL